MAVQQTKSPSSRKNSSAPMRLLDPSVLSGLSNLELVARTLVDGVLIGLHRSPQFGFSQEFAEYRAYNEGDDLRYVDWNVYARTGRTFIKRYKGETNSHLMILMDTSASMGYQSKQASVSKLDYAKFLAASLAFLACKQMDAVGLIQFDEQLRSYRKPSSRTGQLQAVLHAIDAASVQGSTHFHLPVEQMVAMGSKRGMVAVISDFYTDHESLLQAVRPLALQGQDLVLFQVLDPAEIKPEIKTSTLLEDAETGEAVEVSPDYMSREYRDRIDSHIDSVKTAAAAMRADHILLNTAEPLDRGLHGYLQFRQRA